jgi:hypothetical protein
LARFVETRESSRRSSSSGSYSDGCDLRGIFLIFIKSVPRSTLENNGCIVRVTYQHIQPPCRREEPKPYRCVLPSQCGRICAKKLWDLSEDQIGSQRPHSEDQALAQPRLLPKEYKAMKAKKLPKQRLTASVFEP